MLYCIIFGIGFLIYGLAFSTGKPLDKVKGWTRIPEEERRKIQVLPLCRNIGCAISLAGILLLLGGIYPSFREGGLHLAMLGWFALCIGDIVFISKSGRYVQGTELAGKPNKLSS